MITKQEFDKNCAIVKSALEKSSFIRAFGFSFDRSEIGEDESVGYFYEIAFRNPSRCITASYSPGIQRDSMVFSVEREGSAFILESYLTAHDLNSQYSEKLKFSNYQGNFCDRMDAFLKGIAPLFETYLTDILSGEQWEEVPFDWGDDK